MKFHRTLWHICLGFLFLFSLGWDIWLYTLPTHTTPMNFWYNVIYGTIFLAGGFVAVYHAFKLNLSTNLGKMLFFFGLGLLSFWAGNGIWAFYTFFLRTEIPFPSFADLMYGLMYPLMAIGAIYLLQIHKALITKALIRDTIIIMVVSFLVIFGFFARPDISAELSWLQKFINVYYPFGDVVIISIALISLRIAGAKMHASLYILAGGLALFTVADLLFTYRNAVEAYWNGDISDVLYSAGGYVISAGLFEVIASLTQGSDTTVISHAPVNITQSASEEKTI